MWGRFKTGDRSFELYKTIVNLPPAAKFILYILDVKKILNRKGIEQETLLPKRTVGSALKSLVKAKLIEKIQGKALEHLSLFSNQRIDYRETYYRIIMK